MGRGDQADQLTFYSDVPYPITVPCHLCHPRACATTASQVLVLLSFSAVYEEEKGQYSLLATILDPNHDRTGDMRRWQAPVNFKALICFVHDTLHCCHRQELTRERENHIPKQMDLSVGLSGGVGCISWNA